MHLIGTFIKNTDKIIEQILQDKVVDITSNFVIFNSRKESEYSYLNSVFIPIKVFSENLYGVEKAVNWLCHSTKSDRAIKEAASQLEGKKWRLIYLKDNQTTQLPHNLYKKVEEKLAKSGIKLVKEDHDHEMWIFLDSESKKSWIGIKISSHPDYHTSDRKGVLRPQLAYMLNFLSNPEQVQVTLDPFAGSGIILQTRSKYFPGSKFISVEQDSPRITQSSKPDRVEVIVGDYFEQTIQPASIDAIVTDPPWGKFDESADIERLYSKMFTSFAEQLKPGGILVLLTSLQNRDLVLSNLGDKFTLQNEYPLKVWGQRAVIFQIYRN